MKFNKFNIIVLVSLIFVFFQTNTNAFDRLKDMMIKGNEAYQNKEYEKAIENYNTILNENYVSTALYFNLGNSYYRIGKLGRAILYYEKALKLSPDDENTIYNLSIAKAHTKDKIKEVPELFITKWWNSFLTILPASGWTIVVLSAYFILLFMIAAWVFTKNSSVKQFAFFGGSAAFVVFIITITLLVSAINHENSNKYGILMQQITTAKVSPDEGSSDAFVMHEGVKFQLEDELDGWSEVKLPDGKVGWIQQISFEEI